MQQETYSKQLHQLDIRTIDREALYVLEKLTASGYIAYLVGGGVRDLLLKKRPKDYDISTSAEPEQIRKLFKNCILIGRRFRLAHIRFGKKIIEVSTFRSGDNDDDALILRDNQWGSPEEDVLRRDFTINGLFYDAAKEMIIDYVGGFQDLQKQYLRTIGHPFTRFKQDPVRMIRLLKFVARFGFEVDHDTKIALLESKHEILKSSSTRILEELFRMLESGASRSFFQLMADYGLLSLMLPSLSSFLETKEGEEIYAYLQEIDRMILEEKQVSLDRSFLLAGLVFPLFQKKILFLASREKKPHLGEIQDEAFKILNELFRPFFLLPKRIKIITALILSSQYRLTPLEKRKTQSKKLCNDPSFPLAVSFLKLRSCQEPGLQKVWQEWDKLSVHSSTSEEAPFRKKRRRRRRPPRASS